MNFDRVIGQLALAGIVAYDNAKVARATGNFEQEKACEGMLAELTEAARVLMKQEVSDGREGKRTTEANGPGPISDGTGKGMFEEAVVG